MIYETLYTVVNHLHIPSTHLSSKLTYANIGQQFFAFPQN